MRLGQNERRCVATSNRTSLGLKQLDQIREQQEMQTSNRTSLGLKLLSFCATRAIASSSNRTSLGLKHVHKAIQRIVCRLLIAPVWD